MHSVCSVTSVCAWRVCFDFRRLLRNSLLDQRQKASRTKSPCQNFSDKASQTKATFKSSSFLNKCVYDFNFAEVRVTAASSILSARPECEARLMCNNFLLLLLPHRIAATNQQADCSAISVVVHAGPSYRVSVIHRTLTWTTLGGLYVRTVHQSLILMRVRIILHRHRH